MVYKRNKTSRAYDHILYYFTKLIRIINKQGVVNINKCGNTFNYHIASYLCDL